MKSINNKYFRISLGKCNFIDCTAQDTAKLTHKVEPVLSPERAFEILKVKI